VPAAGDDAVIANGHTVTLTGVTSITNLTINAGGTLAGNTFLITVSGNYTNNGTHSGSGGATLNGTNKNIDGTGNITNTGTFTLSGGAKSILSTANLSFSGVIAISGAITITNNGTVTTSTNITGSVAGSTWVNAANSTLNISGALLATGTLTASANPNTINYNGAAQTVKATATYHHLTLSGSGVKTLTTTSTAVNGTLTLSGTATTTTVVGITIGALNVGSGTTFTAAGFALTVTGTTSIFGTHTISSSAGTKIYTGLVTINSGGTWNDSGNSAITFRGGITHNGTTFTAGSGIQTFDTNVQSIGGSTALSIPSITVTTVTLTNNQTLTVTTALAGTGGLTNNATGTLNINFTGAAGITTLTATASGNTVDYQFAGAQAVKAVTYHHLKLSSSGVKTLPSPLTINGNLTLSGTVTASTAGTTTVTGNLTVGTGTTFTAAGFALTVSGTTSISGTHTISSSTGTKIYTGLVTINPGGTWNNSGNSAITFRGGITHNGTTFTSGSGVYTFDTNNQAISGSTTPISITNPTVTTITLNVNDNLSVSGILTDNGVITPGAANTISGAGTLTGNGRAQVTRTVATASFAGQYTTTLKILTNLTIEYVGTASQTVDTADPAVLIINMLGQTASLGQNTVLTGNVTVTAGTLAQAGFTLTISGNLTVNGTLNVTNTLILDGTGKNIDGTGSITGSSTLTLSVGAKSILSSANLTIAPPISILITLSNNGTVSSTDTATGITGVGTWINAANSTLNIAGPLSVMILTATANPNTVNYNGTTVDQTVKSTTYHHLQINKSTTTATLGGAVTINGNLTVTSGTYNANGQTTTVTGLAAVNGGMYQAATATQTFNGGLTISSGTFTGSSGAVDVNGNLTLSGGILTAPSGSFTISGNWNRTAGTFTPGLNTVTFDGTSQMISGITTFYNLTKNVTLAATLTFENTMKQTVTHTLTLNGALGQLLSLRSNLSGTKFKITLPTGGTQSLSFLDVQDSDASGGLTLAAGSTSVNSGNNLNWTFTILSIAVNTTTWSVGTVDAGTAQISTSGNKINVTNDGNLTETFTLQIFNEDDRNEWTHSSLKTGAGNNIYALSGIFCATGDSPITTSFNETDSEDVLTTTQQTATSTKFAFASGTANAVNVAASGQRSLWLRLDMPTAVSGTFAFNQHTITVRIGAL